MPTPDGRKALARILTECGGFERAGLYLAWVHESRDEWAMQLRGEAPWPAGGGIRARLSLEELARHVEGRLAQAEAWEARHRREIPPPAPVRGEPFRRAPQKSIAQLLAERDAAEEADIPERIHVTDTWRSDDPTP